MDPTACYLDMFAAMNRKDFATAREFALALKEWLDRGGFYPPNYTETEVKGKELFHPVRIALTGSHSGPEFDKLIPLIEEGSMLPLPEHIPSVRERVLAFTS